MSGRPTGGQLAVLGIEILLISVMSYYGMKWLVNVLDPTNKQKEVARKQVFIWFLEYLQTVLV